MKTGKSLTELAIEIERRAEAKKDYVVGTENVALDVQGEGPPLLTFGDKVYGINGIAHDQIGEHAGIPAKYYDRMLAEEPGLLATNVNRWFQKYPAPRMIRTLDNVSRAFLSDRFRPLENEDLANAILPVLLAKGVEILSADVTERKLYIKAVDRSITKDVPKGRQIGDGSHVFFDTLSPAITISNSEVGLGALSVETSIFTKVCTNLATISKDGSLRRYHVGGKHEIGAEITHLLSDQTRRLKDATLWSEVSDVVSGAFEAARFQALVDDKILGMVEQKIAGDPVKVIELSAKRFGFNETEKTSVLKHLIEGGDLSRYGVFNAITRTAEDLDSYDRATEFERVGGQVIELAKNEWKALAEAA
jgi:hypothetical protein